MLFFCFLCYFSKSNFPAGVVPTVAESVGERPGIAKNSATSKGEAGSSWSKDGGLTSAAVAATEAKFATDARPPEIAKQSATTKPELAESSGEAGGPE